AVETGQPRQVHLAGAAVHGDGDRLAVADAGQGGEIEVSTLDGVQVQGLAVQGAQRSEVGQAQHAAGVQGSHFQVAVGKGSSVAVHAAQRQAAGERHIQAGAVDVGQVR